MTTNPPNKKTPGGAFLLIGRLKLSLNKEIIS